MMSGINDKRQTNIDLVKFFSIVFMISIHALMVYVHDFSTGFNYVVNTILGGPLAAPVFMVSMGVGFSYTKKQDPKSLFKRGVNILILAYVLNILISPMHFDLTELVITKTFLTELLVSFLYGDILHFAGIAMIVFALLKKFKFNDVGIFAVAVLLSLIGSVAPTLNTENGFLTVIVGLFIPTTCSNKVIACFPFSAWFIFPAFGYLFGNRLKKVKELDKFYLMIGAISLPIALLGIGIETYFKNFMMAVGDTQFYLMVTHDAVLSIFAALSMYAVCYFIVKILPLKLKNAVTVIGNSLNIIYMLSWVLIVYTQVTVYFIVDELVGAPLYTVMVLTCVVSVALGVLIKKLILKRLKENERSFVKFINP